VAKKSKNAISPTRGEDYPEWYQQVVVEADLAESSSVRGCMVIKPWGLAIWENIKAQLDGWLAETGHQNAYFPLLIPLSHLEREAKHVEGFAKECAVVTHHRLEASDAGLVPAGKLEEPFVIRPTSETIIGETFSRWVRSYRDLPLLINQWANVVRWELRPRIFLRSTEFLWQEGHTVHARAEQALEETLLILDLYRRLAEEVLAVPVVRGQKSESERFPGAVETFTIEAMMQDRKALQAGTSHFLGQNFARASGIRFADENEQLCHGWTTSWGVSTRLMGAIVMTHGDDDGLIVPPRIAPDHVVILPIAFKADDSSPVLEACHRLARELRELKFAGQSLRVRVDNREMGGGVKAWQWIKRGIPIRVEIGPRDIAAGSVFVGRRDHSPSQKTSLKTEDFIGSVVSQLEEIQSGLLARARTHQTQHSHLIDGREEFYAFFTPPAHESGAPVPMHGGFALTHWNGSPEVERRIKADLGVTIRCLPLEGELEQSRAKGSCPFTGEPSAGRALWAKSY
jgi:prolyl-tRNA synthetase